MCSICFVPGCVPGCPNYEPKIVTSCDECWKNIFEGEEYEEIDGMTYCAECAEKMKEESEDDNE